MSSLEMENLPDEVIVEIFRLLDVKTRVKMLTVNQRWSRLMPFADELGCLHIGKLPFKRPLDEERSSPVERSVVTAALRAILPLPEVGPKLKSVEFGRVELAAVHFALIDEFCTQLTDIDLFDIHVREPNDFNFAAIQQMSNLRGLRVGRSSHEWLEKWSEADQARFLLNLSNLIGQLDLKEFRLVYLPFPPAFAAPNLTKLGLTWSENFTDEQLAGICTVSSNLTSLSMAGCYAPTNFTPIGLLTKLTDLTLIDSCVDENHMEIIAQNCTQLSSIHVRNVHLPSQITGITWLRHLPKLKSLVIDFTKGKLADIPHNWAIEELTIEVEDVSEDILLELSRKSPLLKRLRLSNGSLTDDVVVELANRWEMLGELRLSHVKMSDKSVAQLGQGEYLRLLDLRSGNFFVDNLRPLLTKRQQLQISTPLNIRLDCFSRQDFSPQQIDQLKEEFRQVKVRVMADCYD